MINPCLLCGGSYVVPWIFSDQTIYLHCPDCGLIVLDPKSRLAADVERERYLLHQTTPLDAGYRKFVSVLMDEVHAGFPRGARGLDFGAGHQPVLSEWLREDGFEMQIYDPFFWPDAAVLRHEYDFVVACEVVEHFFDPFAEFTKLKNLVRPGGRLVVQTEPPPGRAAFERWYYRRDPSHVAFYDARTFDWMGKQLKFKDVRHRGRVTTFTR